MHFGHLRLPGREHAFGVMRLDPALQEARRHRKPHAFVLHAFQVHAREPACIDVLAHARAQTAFDARPTILFRICHCEKLFKCELSDVVGIAVAGFLPRRDLRRTCSGQTSTVRRNAAISSMMSGAEGFPRGQRILGLSATRVGRRLLGGTASKSVWSENGNWPTPASSP